MGTNCPNCGAPIEHYYNHKCPYCKTFLHNTDEDVLKMDNYDIRVDKLEVKNCTWQPAWELTIYGTALYRFNYWCEDEANRFNVIEFKEPKRVGYTILIDYDYILKHRKDRSYIEVMNYIEKLIPRRFFQYQGNANKIYSCIDDLLAEPFKKRSFNYYE